MSKNHSPFTSSSSPLSYWNFFSYLQHPYPLTPKLNPLKDFISLCSKNAIKRILLITTLVMNNTNLKERRPVRMSACSVSPREASIILSWFFGYFFIKKKVTRNKMPHYIWSIPIYCIRHFFLTQWRTIASRDTLPILKNSIRWKILSRDAQKMPLSCFRLPHCH